MEIISDVDDWTVPNIAAMYTIHNYFSNRYPHENYTTTIIFPSLWMSKCISQYLPGSPNHEKIFLVIFFLLSLKRTHIFENSINILVI